MATDRARHRSPNDERHGRGSRSDLPGDDEDNPTINPTAFFPRTDLSQLRHRTSEGKLPQIAHDFLLKVPRHSYGESLSFITNNQESLVQSSLIGLYIMEAVDSLVNNDNERAENCIEKALLIEDVCRVRRSNDRVAYFKKLQSQKGKTYENFRKYCNQTYAQCKTQASGKQRRTSSFLDAGINPNYEVATSYGRGYNTANFPHVLQQRESFGASGGQWQSELTSYQTLPDQMESMGVADSHVARDPKVRHAADSYQSEQKATQIQQQTSWNRSNHVQNPCTTPYTQSGKKAQHTETISDHAKAKAKDHSTVDLTKIDWFSNVRGVPSKDPTEDDLDDRYYRRTSREAGKLFKVGRVFSVLAHYDYNGDPRSFRRTPEEWLTPGPKGSSIISHIQRYAVVKEGHGFCWAVPISTYGGQGTRKRGLSLDEIEAHAIAYSTRQPPNGLEAERELPKIPIAIDCDEDHRLHPASRINFAKVRTIEHNVRVMNIGRVASSSLNHFHEYWNMEIARQYTNRRNTRHSTS